MSPGRSANGSKLRRNVEMRKYKSSRNSRVCMANRKSLLVAATTRTFNAMGDWPPKRVNVRSCNTRNNLVCNDIGISPISSKKMVPPCACSNRPLCSFNAPVNAPFSWPNNKSSIKFSGNAAQLRATNGCLARVEDSCNTRANTSLPEPVGPTNKAVTSVCATRWANANKCWLAGSTNTALLGLLTCVASASCLVANALVTLPQALTL